jgi:hypothetical protein
VSGAWIADQLEAAREHAEELRDGSALDHLNFGTW